MGIILSEKILLDKVTKLLESARISVKTVEDYVDFYRTGKLPEPFDIPPDTELEFNLKPVTEKPQADNLDLIRDKTTDILIELDALIDEVSSFNKIQ
jgi:hypothetical protein